MKNLLVVGDKIKISQVLRNMISNALKFTPTGGQVTVSAEWNKEDKQFKDLDINKKINEHKKSASDVEANNEPAADDLILEFSSTHTSANITIPNCIRSKLYSLRHNSIASPHHHTTGSSKQKTEHMTDYKYAGSVTIKVTDTGAGLSKENLSQLFQERVQFNANKLQGGGGSTGLGLWISKGIVDMHHELMYATSPGIGLGCSFVVSIILLLYHNLYDHLLLICL